MKPESSTDDGNDEYKEIFNVLEQIEEDHSRIFDEAAQVSHSPEVATTPEVAATPEAMQPQADNMSNSHEDMTEMQSETQTMIANEDEAIEYRREKNAYIE